MLDCRPTERRALTNSSAGTLPVPPEWLDVLGFSLGFSFKTFLPSISSYYINSYCDKSLIPELTVDLFLDTLHNLSTPVALTRG